MNRRRFVATLGGSFAASAWARTAMANKAESPAASQASKASLRRYQPDWASLKRHACPKWCEDAKLGTFIHYGLYSVPGWAPTLELTKRGEIDWSKFCPDMSEWFRNDPYAEWYMNTSRIKGSNPSGRCEPKVILIPTKLLARESTAREFKLADRRVVLAYRRDQVLYYGADGMVKSA